MASGRLEGALEVERVLGAMPDQAPGGVTEAADRGMLHRVHDPRGELPPRRPLPGVQRQLHPVELREDVVREVERAVADDVALDPAEHAEGRELLVHRGDLLGLPAQIVAVEAWHDAHRTGVVADRKVLVAERPRRLGHLADGCAAVGRIRVAVEVAADPIEREKVVGHRYRRQLAQLGRDVRQPEQAEDARLVGCVGQWPERRHVLGRPGRLDEHGPEALG